MHPSHRGDPGGRRVSSPRYSEEGKAAGGLERRLSPGGSRQKCLYLQGAQVRPADFLVPFRVALENRLKNFSGIRK